MKRLFTVIFLMLIALPASADIINPRLSQDERLQISEKRRAEYAERQRIASIRRVCGKADNINKKDCKAKLKKDYQDTVKYLEKDYQKKANK